MKTNMNSKMPVDNSKNKSDINAQTKVNKTVADKTAVKNDASCPVDQTKGMSYLPPKDENHL